MLPILRAACLALAGLLAAGCLSSRQEADGPGPQPAPSESFGAFRATLTLLVEPPKRERVTLTARVFRDRAGRVAVTLAKVDHDLVVAVLAEGRLACLLPRSGSAGAVYEGPASAPGLPPLLAHLDVLAAEIGDGPVPQAPVLDQGAWRLAQGPWRARLRADARGLREKALLDAGGEVALRVLYADPVPLGGVPRPAKATLHVADGTVITVVPGSASAEPDVAARRFRLPPAADGAARVDARGLVDAFADMD